MNLDEITSIIFFKFSKLVPWCSSVSSFILCEISPILCLNITILSIISEVFWNLFSRFSISTFFVNNKCCASSVNPATSWIFFSIAETEPKILSNFFISETTFFLLTVTLDTIWLTTVASSFVVNEKVLFILSSKESRECKATVSKSIFLISDLLSITVTFPSSASAFWTVFCHLETSVRYFARLQYLSYSNVVLLTIFSILDTLLIIWLETSKLQRKEINSEAVFKFFKLFCCSDSCE